MLCYATSLYLEHCYHRLEKAVEGGAPLLVELPPKYLHAQQGKYENE